MSAHYYQDELKASSIAIEADEASRGVSAWWMAIPCIALLVSGFVFGDVVAHKADDQQIKGYQELICAYQQRIDVLIQENAPAPLPVPTSGSVRPKDPQNMPKPPTNRPPAPHPTGAGEKVPPMAPGATPNPITTMPPAPTVEGAPGPDDPGTWIPDPDAQPIC